MAINLQQSRYEWELPLRIFDGLTVFTAQRLENAVVENLPRSLLTREKTWLRI